VLARLEALEGVAAAGTNYAGDLLRLRLSDDVAPEVQLLLSDLGYEGEVVLPDAVPATTVWYDTRSVGELSHIEAAVIADRIVPPFASERELSVDEATRLRAAVVAALQDAFLRYATAGAGGTGAFRSECVLATVTAARAIVGMESARALGDLLDVDLGQDHRGSAEDSRKDSA
jgi:hypothetical protein